MKSLIKKQNKKTHKLVKEFSVHLWDFKTWFQIFLKISMSLSSERERVCVGGWGGRERNNPPS